MTDTALANETRAYVALRDWLAEQYQLPPDDQVVLDTAEGATNLHEMIGALARQARLRKARADALRTIIGENETRLARDEHAIEVLRSRIAQAMVDAGLKKVTAPDATLSVRMGESHPRVTSKDELPDWAWRTKTTKEPDMEAIRRALDDRINGSREQVPGVVMTNPAPILTIRAI
jgi:hypothetical protein